MKNYICLLSFVLILDLLFSSNIFAQNPVRNENYSNLKRFERVENIAFKCQISINFFPNKIGDFWEYIEEDTTTLFSQFLSLKFSISREVLGDTIMNNGLTYKKVKWQNEANSVNYLPEYEFLRVDSIGNVNIFYNASDHLLFDFTLDINQTYPAHLLNHYWKVLDKYNVIGFGDTLQAIDFGLFNQNNIMMEVYKIVESFGIIFYQKDLLNYSLPKGNFWGAVINGQEFGTLIVKKQTVDWKQFYPLNIGDYWVYEGFDGNIPIINSVRIIGDTIMPDNNSYSVFKEIDHTFGYTSLSYRRLDSLGRVFYWEAWNDTVKQYFKFSNSVGDTLKAFSINVFFRLNDKYISSYPDIVELNNYLYPDIAYIQHDYDKGLGLYRTTGDFYLLECSGAYINGEIIYGDTTLVSINEDLFELPKTFSILPCYPNPFNSETTLQFYISNFTNVKIEVYNLIGQSVISIFNDFLPAGYHKQKIELNDLSSGVYFVVINSGSQKLVNKIIYLK